MVSMVLYVNNEKMKARKTAHNETVGFIFLYKKSGKKHVILVFLGYFNVNSRGVFA